MKMKKNKGQIGIIVPLYLFLFALVIMLYLLQMYVFHIVGNDTEDALAASNLASAVIDIQEFGATHNIVISSPSAAYEVYKDALKVNMGLDAEWNSNNNAVISGQVEVVEYIIYNVRGNDVEIHCFGEHPYEQMVPGGKGTVTAPNGKIIETTSVYSKITFPVTGMFNVFNITVQANKDKLVDIAKN